MTPEFRTHKQPRHSIHPKAVDVMEANLGVKAMNLTPRVAKMTKAAEVSEVAGTARSEDTLGVEQQLFCTHTHVQAGPP